MQRIRFTDGSEMPAVGLGTWKTAPGVAGAAVRAAIDAGYRHIDCAAIYGNQPEIGGTLAAAFAQGAVRRDELWITSKLWNDCHAAPDVIPALEKTLSDLRLEYLDLYLVHWPIALRKGVTMPASPQDYATLDEVPLSVTWERMEAAVQQRLCRHIGVSNFSVAKLRALSQRARIRPEMNQFELHPYLQQPELVAYCRANGIAVTAYSPLGSADRPPALRQDDEPVLLQDPVIARIADRLGATPAQVLIRWAIERGVAVIPKSARPERMRENLAAAELRLSQEDLRAIAALDRARRYVTGAFWARAGSPYTVAGLWDEA